MENEYSPLLSSYNEGIVPESKPKNFFCSGRFLILVLFLIQASYGGAVFASFNFAWICMVNSTNITDNKFEVYNWGRNEQKTIFAAYNIGSVLSQIPAGLIATKYGPKWVYFGCLLIAGVSNGIIPLVAGYGYILVAVLRGITGAFVNTVFPISYSVINRWVPESELGLALGIAMTGLPLGQMLTLPFSGLECNSIGWPYVFYIPSAVGAVCLLMWVMFFTNGPTNNRFIGIDEKMYIICNRPKMTFYNDGGLKAMPWGSIAVSPAVWACISANIGYCFLGNMVLQFTPTYLHEVTGISVINNGFLSSLPILAQVIGRNVFGYLSDLKVWSSRRTLQLRLFNSIAYFGAAASLMTLVFVHDFTSGIIQDAMLVSSLVFITISFGGFLKSPILFAPAYSSILSGLMSTFGNIGAVVMAYVVGYLTPQGTVSQWNDVFYVVSGVLIASGVIFLAFGEGKVQKWAKLPN